MLTNRGNYHYKSKKDGQAILVKRIREVAQLRMHYGYKRIWSTPILESTPNRYFSA